MSIDFEPDALREKYQSERDKRVRADANEQYVEMKGQFAHYLDGLTFTCDGPFKTSGPACTTT